MYYSIITGNFYKSIYTNKRLLYVFTIEEQINTQDAIIK